MTKRFLTVILITLFSAVAMFANDISTEVQEEQKIEQQATPDFSSNSAEFSLAEKDFASKYKINPRNTADVWYKYKKLIRTGIGMAVGGGLYIIAAAATLLTLVGLEVLRFGLTQCGMTNRSAKVAFTVRDQAELKDAIQRLKVLGCRVSRCSTSSVKGAWLRVVMEIRYHEKVENDGRLLSELASHPDLRLVKND